MPFARLQHHLGDARHASIVFILMRAEQSGQLGERSERAARAYLHERPRRSHSRLEIDNLGAVVTGVNAVDTQIILASGGLKQSEG